MLKLSGIIILHFSSQDNKTMIMFIILKYPSWLCYSAIVVWLLQMPNLGCCHKTGGTTNFTCVETERQALLEFKQGLEIGNKSLLSDWNAENMECCTWEGIHCSKHGRVMALDIGRGVISKYTPTTTSMYNFERLRGEIGPSLFDLPFLKSIDLSYNRFHGKIPSFVGSLKRLRYFNLSFNSFSGIVPHQLGNLSALESFDFDGNFNLEVDSLAWISGLSSLNYLSMKGLNLSSTTDWLQSITNLPSLTEVYLQYCMLHPPSADKYGNSTKPLQLQKLDLSMNEFASVTFLSNLVSIKHLDLSFNYLEGEIPELFSTNLTNLLTLNMSENMLSNSSGFLQLGSTSLHELRLDSNKLTGSLPDLSKFPSLRVITVARNEFKDHLDRFLEQGSRLVKLDLSSNAFDGVLQEDNFEYLTKLQVLILSFNSISLNVSTWWIPPFQLAVVKLRNCKVGPGFPNWLRAQSNLIHLDISNSGISKVIPNWFWNISTRLQYVNISHNSIKDKLPNYLPPSYTIVDFSSNQLYGALPSFSSELAVLDFSHNKFSGSISFLCSLKVGTLLYLDLHDNLLSGSLRTCWERVDGLALLNLNNNNFSGHLPYSMGKLRWIMSLSLRNNSLSGELPSSLINCQRLLLLDLGENQLSGVVPTWLGTSLQDLVVLSLHANMFGDIIPRSLCHLHSLQILDLSFNNISGMIPSCLNNFTAMKEMGTSAFVTHLVYGNDPDEYGYSEKYFTTWIAWKGVNHEYINQNHLELLILIDLSNNKLSGPIPQELASLYKLISLNLSRNSLTGIIPNDIGQLEMLESLDMSKNMLSGEIPRSMANLASLSYLDLSSNNLSGKIPSSTQLQSFDASAFNNNSMLCGPPTTNPCQGNRSVHNIPTNDRDRDNGTEAGIFHEDIWFYISIGFGFLVGFWGFCGTLVLNASWRQSYFHVLNNWKDSLCGRFC
ncbi:transmembrane signal receptor [Lithospermum erythrorhizon]|uniref:Transmembrane signal receptor n=1 Tax=Lithospermum erythrorhizon TaxID=34254 RepID=A0AAV3RIF4_LITER